MKSLSLAVSLHLRENDTAMDAILEDLLGSLWQSDGKSGFFKILCESFFVDSPETPVPDHLKGEVYLLAFYTIFPGTFRDDIPREELFTTLMTFLFELHKAFHKNIHRWRLLKDMVSRVFSSHHFSEGCVYKPFVTTKQVEKLKDMVFNPVLFGDGRTFFFPVSYLEKEEGRSLFYFSSKDRFPMMDFGADSETGFVISPMYGERELVLSTTLEIETEGRGFSVIHSGAGSQRRESVWDGQDSVGVLFGRSYLDDSLRKRRLLDLRFSRCLSPKEYASETGGVWFESQDVTDRINPFAVLCFLMEDSVFFSIIQGGKRKSRVDWMHRRLRPNFCLTFDGSSVVNSV